MSLPTSPCEECGQVFVEFIDRPHDHDCDRLCGDCLLKQRDDAANLLRRLARLVTKGNQLAASEVAESALNFLRRKNLTGDILRDG